MKWCLDAGPAGGGRRNRTRRRAVVPQIIARLPEPAPDQDEEDEEPKQLYVEVPAQPGCAGTPR